MLPFYLLERHAHILAPSGTEVSKLNPYFVAPVTIGYIRNVAILMDDCEVMRTTKANSA